jgi:hypothetical protein
VRSVGNVRDVLAAASGVDWLGLAPAGERPPPWSGLVVALPLFVLLISFHLWVERRLRGYGYVKTRPSPDRDPGHVFDPDRSRSFRVGARIGRMNATVPLVKMTVGVDVVVLRGPFTSAVIDRRRVSGVRAVGRFMTSGLRFESADGVYDGVIVWALDRDVILDAFASLGWPAFQPARPRSGDARPL